MCGKLIVIEGLDGSGKSTQTQRLHRRLLEHGVAVERIKLPDYDDPSSTLVQMYLAGDFGKAAGDVNAYAASVFYTVDRFASFQRHWGKSYAAGKLILADRYATSNAVHQMGKLPADQWGAYLEWLDDLEYEKVGVPRPDLVFYLDMPVAISQTLMSRRYHGDEVKKDVHECDVGYLNACRKTAFFAAEKCGWHVINCAAGGQPRDMEEIEQEIYSIVLKEIIE